MNDLSETVAGLAAEHDFSGAIRVDRGDEMVVNAAYGLAHRGWRIANTPDTRFGIASGLKGFTALAVMSLVEEGTLSLSTPAREVLGDDLPLIDAGVTVEHLLAHRSGIGDYLDEDVHQAVTDYVMPVPVHQLDSSESFLAVLDGFATSFPPGQDFAYNNGAFVVLALIAERASGIPYPELVVQRVCGPAGLQDTAFLRSDEPDGGVALGYLHAGGDLRTNLLHLPVRGIGDGGIYSTTADFVRFWAALFAGRIVAREVVAEMVRPRSTSPSGIARYGLGFWLHGTGPSLNLEGYDAGVSFRSTHDPTSKLTHTVVSNTSEGAWPIIAALDELLGT